MHFSPELHHELGIGHLVSNERAALWAGMGLGKTAMSLAALNELFQSGRTRGALVVAPLRVCILTWPAEVQKWDQFRWMKVAHVMTENGWRAMENGEAQIYLINWDNLAFIAQYFLHGKRAHQLPFDTVIFDEATKAKSHESKRVNTFRAYINKFPRRWELTGTPAPNSLLDLYAQIRLLDDGQRFGPSFASFRDAYFQQVGQYGFAIRSGCAEKIHEKVSDISLVLRSSDFLDVPDTVVEDIEVAFPSSVKGLYEELAEELLAITDKGEQIEAINRGVLVNKLLQVTGGAVYLEQQYDQRGLPLPKDVAHLHDTKVKALLSLTRTIKEPVLLACQYRHEQDRLAKALPTAVRLDSATNEQKLRELEARWTQGRIPYLIAHPASIGHGLNLQHGGRIVIWYSHTWSRELYDQTNARVARTGQQKVPMVYRLICPGTMDDAVVEVLRNKGATQNALLQAVENFRKLRSNKSFTQCPK